MTLNVQRNYTYLAAVAIDEESYQIAETADGPLRFVQTDTTTERFETCIREAVTDIDGVRRLRWSAVEPGYVAAIPDLRKTVAPNDMLNALRDAAARYNKRHATARPDGTGYFDGVELGDAAYVEALAPEDAIDPETFVERETGGPNVPDADEPVMTWEGNGSAGGTSVAGASGITTRKMELVFIQLIEDDLHDPLTYNREQGIDIEIQWDDHTRQTFTEFLDKYHAGRDARFTLWPTHAEIRVRAEALGRPPDVLLASFFDSLARVNNHRGEREVDALPNKDLPRRQIPWSRRVYVGATRSQDDHRLDEWVREHGLDDDDLHALATGLGDELREAAETVEETADDEGGKVTAGRLRRLLGGGA